MAWHNNYKVTCVCLKGKFFARDFLLNRFYFFPSFGLYQFKENLYLAAKYLYYHLVGLKTSKVETRLTSK
jgi:hypothetical protein